MTAMNLLKISGKADYINTGTWSKKAIKEAKKSAKCPVGFITSLEENMPEEFAKDLLRHAIIPLTGLESSLGALGALRDISNIWNEQSTRSIIWAQWPDRNSRTINEFQSKKVLNL